MKILVVDDEPLARERLVRLLGNIRPQATCLQAGDGNEALAQVATADPDLVLLDIRMPGKDGIEVAAELEQRESPPAIMDRRSVGESGAVLKEKRWLTPSLS